MSLLGIVVSDLQIIHYNWLFLLVCASVKEHVFSMALWLTNHGQIALLNIYFITVTTLNPQTINCLKL